MASSHTGRFVYSLHRAILGGLLTVFGLVTLGTLFSTLDSGDYFISVVSLAVLLGYIFWVLHLFEAGLNEQ